MSARLCEPAGSAAVAISYMLVGAMIAARVRGARAPRGGLSQAAPIQSARTELMGTVRPTQIPVPHVADELEKLVGRGVVGLGTDGQLAEVLGYRSPLGAQIEAIFWDFASLEELLLESAA